LKCVTFCHNSVQWVRPCLHTQITCQSRLICTNRVFAAKLSDVQKQQTAAANVSLHRPAHEALSKVEAALHHEDYFNVKELVTLQDLFNARVYFGHNSGLQHASMTPFIFGTRQGVDIIDLEQTLPLLHHALNVCAHIVYRGGMVLFLSRNMQILPWVERMAKEVGEYSHCRIWRKGTFTDAENVFGTLPIYPELCVFFNTLDTVFDLHRGVIESSKLLIPTIGIVDTNCDITHVTYPIPGNDDSPASQHLYIELFRKTVLRAKEKRKEDGVDTISNLIEGS